MKKLYDLAVKTSSYTGKDGQVKNKWQTVGSVMEGDKIQANGQKGKFIMIDRTFNPAGVPNPDNKDSVLISMFAPKEKDQPGQAVFGENPFSNEPEF